MFVDVCLPEGNEEELLTMAKKLGTKKVLMLYKKPKKEVFEFEGVEVINGLLCEKFPGRKGINFGFGERFNAEANTIPFLYGFEEVEKKDSVHYKRAGINQVIAKILVEKDKTYVIDFSRLLKSSEKDKVLGRISQNLMMASKYGFKVAICSFASKPEQLRAAFDLRSIIDIFGYQKIAKESVSNLSAQIDLLKK